MAVIWKVVKSGRVCAGNPILLSLFLVKALVCLFSFKVNFHRVTCFDLALLA